jgi:hypothetical protein
MLQGYASDPNKASFASAHAAGIFAGFTAETVWATNVGPLLNCYVLANAHNSTGLASLLSGVTSAAARNVLMDYLVVLGLSGAVSLTGADITAQRANLAASASRNRASLTLDVSAYVQPRISQFLAGLSQLKSISTLWLKFPLRSDAEIPPLCAALTVLTNLRTLTLVLHNAQITSANITINLGTPLSRLTWLTSFALDMQNNPTITPADKDKLKALLPTPRASTTTF